MLVAAIICSVVSVILAITSLVYADDEVGKCVGAAIAHVIVLVAATVCYCLYSSKASFAAGILFTITTGILIIVQLSCDDFSEEVRIAAFWLGAANAACAAAGYINVYAFFELGISFSVLGGLAFINLIVALLYGYDWTGTDALCNIQNIVFAVLCSCGIVAGFTVNAVLNQDVTVEAECAVYEYDYMHSKVGAEAQDEIYFGEYYALQMSFEWSGLKSYTTKSEDIAITITFPAAVTSYIAEGVSFSKSDINNKVWTFKYELNSNSDKRMTSGYFIFNYKYANMSIPVSPFKVQINAVKDDEDDKTVFDGYEQSYKYVFKRKSYDFGEANCVKDLSIAPSGYYRLIPPAECRDFRINIYDSRKSGVYYSEQVTVSGEYYLLNIPYVLQTNVSESIYEKIYNSKERLVVEVIAVGNANYEDTSYEFYYTAER